MKEAFYFSHDYNSQNDPKIESMLFDLSWESYGLYWALIEKLAQEPTHKMRTQYDRISYALRDDKKIVKNIVEDYDLFVIDGDEFYSFRLLSHFDKRAEKSDKARESANSRWNKNKENANALRNECDSNAIKERKGKDSKGKERKENIKEKPKSKIKTFKDLNEDEFIDSLAEHVSTFSDTLIFEFGDYWSEKDSKNKMRFQLEKTWDLKKRLNRWKKNNYNNNNSNKKGGYKSDYERKKELADSLDVGEETVSNDQIRDVEVNVFASNSEDIIKILEKRSL